MEELRLGVIESQFAEIIWSNEPLPSGELVKLCEQKLGWKKSTTYTVLKRLCERGIFQNEKGMVSARMTKEEYDAAQSEKFVEENFGGSLPVFLKTTAARCARFCRGRTTSHARAGALSSSRSAARFRRFLPRSQREKN